MSNGDGPSREHKAKLFTFIFGNPENKRWTLSLYNAVNDSQYTDESAIRFNTLNDYLYVSMKNDTSFLISEWMNLYEHQSTFNPNMPLRMMRYLGNLYYGYVEENGLNIYGDSLIELPIPKLVTFYNGSKKVEDERILKLSDSFKKELRDKADVEVKVRMLNINYNHNEKLLKACQPLMEYSWFIDAIRKYCMAGSVMEEAIGLAFNDMPESFETKPFLRIHFAEVSNMLIAETQEENAWNMIRRAERKVGVDRHLIEQICKKLVKGKSLEVISEEVEENLDIVTKIAEASQKYLPDYDIDAIYEDLHKID